MAKKELDYKKMLQDICRIVEDDFCYDMETHLIPNDKGKTQPFLHSESEEMAKRLARVYSIAHCIHCTTCQGKYLKK